MDVRAALPGLGVASVLAGLALLAPGPASPLAVAPLAGVLIANVGTMPEPWGPGMRVAATAVMRVGVVLLDLSVTPDAVMSLGWRVLLLVLVSVAATLPVRVRLGAALGVPAPAALLVAACFAICGTSAVSAVASLTDARREEIAYAAGLRHPLRGPVRGTPAPAAGPVGAHRRRLRDLGRRSGARHAAGVAAAALAGEDSVTTAVVVKLARVSLLAVLVTLLASSRHHAAPRGHLRGLPPFVLAFVVTAALAAAGVVPPPLLDVAAPTCTALLALGMVRLGSAVRLPDLRRLGLRPLVLGRTSWLLIAGGTLLSVKALVA